jgi:uncharacterized membrane protein
LETIWTMFQNNESEKSIKWSNCTEVSISWWPYKIENSCRRIFHKNVTMKQTNRLQESQEIMFSRLPLQIKYLSYCYSTKFYKLKLYVTSNKTRKFILWSAGLWYSLVLELGTSQVANICIQLKYLCSLPFSVHFPCIRLRTMKRSVSIGLLPS